MTFRWLMKYFKKQKLRTRSNLRHIESEKNICNRNNIIGKIREKVFMKKLKTFQLKTTLHLIIQLQLYSE